MSPSFAFDQVFVALSGAVQVPAIRLPRYPLLQALPEAVGVADSTILLSCPRIPLFYGTLDGISVADELQELSYSTHAFRQSGQYEGRSLQKKESNPKNGLPSCIT